MGNRLEVKMNIKVNNISFNGWKCDKKLEGKLNNEKELNKLANASKVDSMKTYLSKESKYLPSHDLYTTISTKKVNNRYYHGVDCVILSKNTPSEDVSKNIFESAQNSIEKLYDKLAKFAPAKTGEKANIFQKIMKFLKK